MEYSKHNTENKGKDHSDSNSLWNCTISPGWKQYETKILLNALQYYGIGRWKKILDSQCLPDKGDFMGLKVDINKVFLDNMKKTNATRKSNCIINTGDNPTKEERKRRIQENQIKYGLTKEQLAKLVKPEQLKQGVSHFFTLEDIEQKAKKLTTIEILERIDELKIEIERRINLCDSHNTQVYQDIKQKIEEEVLEQESTEISKKRKRKISQKTDKRIKNKKKIKKNDYSSIESSTLEEEEEEEIPLESDDPKEDEIEQIEMDSEEKQEESQEEKKMEQDDELFDYDQEEEKQKNQQEDEQIFMEDDQKNEQIQDDLSEKEAIF